MKILVVCSYRDFISSGIAAFIEDQMKAVCAQGAECEYYLVHGKGVFGYLHEIPALRKRIRDYKPDLIHAHYGLCGLLANMATRRVPVVSTYHGSDINQDTVYRYSKYSIRLSAWNIFVSPKNIEKAVQLHAANASLIPCGIDEKLFVPMDKEDCRRQLAERGKWKAESGRKYVLFSKMFTDDVKDYPLAKKVIERVKELVKEKVELLEFNGFTREESAMLINAVDAVLLTSKTEGSPQVIKEAMSCGSPIVSVDVGDVKERISDVDGCYMAKSRDAEELATLLKKALEYKGKTKGREALLKQNLSNTLIAEQIMHIYQKLLKEK